MEKVIEVNSEAEWLKTIDDISTQKQLNIDNCFQNYRKISECMRAN